MDRVRLRRATSVIVQPVVEPMEHYIYTALLVMSALTGDDVPVLITRPGLG